MRQGFIKVAAVTVDIRVADVWHNCEEICKRMKEAEKAGAKIIVFPELCLTGYTCSDLFTQDILLKEVRKALAKIAEETRHTEALVFVGLPLAVDGELYNVAAAVTQGKVLGLVPKTHIPNYNEFYERRHFAPGMKQPVPVALDEDTVVPMGTRVLFQCRQMPELKIGAEICEDVWAPNPPGVEHALAGATLLVNLSASDETTGKDRYRKSLVTGQSGRLICGYVYCSAGDGESTQDVVYSGHNLIAENGTLLAESRRFCNESIYTELDMVRLNEERRRMSTFVTSDESYINIEFSLKEEKTELTRFVDPAPFVPGNKADREKRCEEIFTIQAMGLKKRLEHTGCKSAVIGISGGLDSTLALLVTSRAFSLLGLSTSLITAVTMPCFGTTDRTYENACLLAKTLGVTLREVDIRESVTRHFADIGQDMERHDVTYENGQARERTQVLMDIANQENGIVVGTGDLSELALGWATYNGDHMSMYGVNGSIPKTLVRYLVRHAAETCGDEALAAVLYDILDTPVSPELLPADEGGRIAQKTEDLVGPYELHDFFLYHFIRYGCPPQKLLYLAENAFAGRYDRAVLLKWLRTFCRRFFQQQFKRSCLPDGPKVGSVTLSPRGDWRMPSDASAALWLREIDELE